MPETLLKQYQNIQDRIREERPADVNALHESLFELFFQRVIPVDTLERKGISHDVAQEYRDWLKKQEQKAVFKLGPLILLQHDEGVFIQSLQNAVIFNTWRDRFTRTKPRATSCTPVPYPCTLFLPYAKLDRANPQDILEKALQLKRFFLAKKQPPLTLIAPGAYSITASQGRLSPVKDSLPAQLQRVNETVIKYPELKRNRAICTDFCHPYPEHAKLLIKLEREFGIQIARPVFATSECLIQEKVPIENGIVINDLHSPLIGNLPPEEKEKLISCQDYVLGKRFPPEIQFIFDPTSKKYYVFEALLA